jgi:hypothetical protein
MTYLPGVNAAVQAALDAKADLPSMLYALKTSDQTGIGTTYEDVSSTGLAVEANKTYYFEFAVIADADATTTGIDIAVNGPSSPTAIVYTQYIWISAGNRATYGATAYDNNTAAGTSLGTARRIYRVHGILRNGANAGTLIARIKRENVGSANCRAGSNGRAWKLN